MPVTKFIVQQRDVAHHDSQQIVKIVCNTARQLSDRLHLLRLPQLLLVSFQFGDVPQGLDYAAVG